MGFLVGLVELGELTPVAGDAEQVESPKRQELPAVGDPVLVAVGGQQLSRIPRKRFLGDGGVLVLHGQPGQPLELEGIDRQVGVREE